MPSAAKSTNTKFKAVKEKLLSEQMELGKRIQNHLGEVHIEYEPDDEAAQATYSVTRDMSAATIERERKTFAELQAALERIDKGDYGVCEACHEDISSARLKALPWARLCISCANSINPSTTMRLRNAS
jgi:DnaK suppressor protein